MVTISENSERLFTIISENSERLLTMISENSERLFPFFNFTFIKGITKPLFSFDVGDSPFSHWVLFNI